jgi:hypothetical protein
MTSPQQTQAELVAGSNGIDRQVSRTEPLQTINGTPVETLAGQQGRTPFSARFRLVACGRICCLAWAMAAAIGTTFVIGTVSAIGGQPGRVDTTVQSTESLPSGQAQLGAALLQQDSPADSESSQGASSPSDESSADDLPAPSAIAGQYGFLPVEVYKFSNDRASSLHVADLNGDGRQDLVVVDHTGHRIELLLQKADWQPDSPVPAPANERSTDVNRLVDLARFERKKIPVDQDLSALTVGDWNSDGRTDLAYFATPDQLVIRWQSTTGEWTNQQTFRLAEVPSLSWLLAAGDLNSDGRTDLVVLGKRETCVLYQAAEGKLQEPQKLLNTSSDLSLAQVADLDGDGRDDLCYLAGEGLNRQLGARLQSARGELGPEFLFDLERPRSVTIRNVDGLPGHELLTIDSRSGRVKVQQLRFKAAVVGEAKPRLVRYGFGLAGSGAQRSFAVGDFDGDRRSDIVVSDPMAARVLLFRQSAGRGLDLGTPFPSSSEITTLKTWVGSPDQPARLVVHSEPEKTIGVSSFVDERLTFPAALPLDLEPLGPEVIDFDGDGRPEIVFFEKSKRTKDSEAILWVYATADDGATWTPHPVCGETGMKVTLPGAPQRLMAANLLGDFRDELVIVPNSKPPVIWQAAADGVLRTGLTTAGSPGTGTLPAATVAVELGGQPGLLVPQQNFARLWYLGAQQRWQVGEQFNAGETNAKITGVHRLNLDETPEPEIVLIDEGLQKLRILKRTPQGDRPWKDVELPGFRFLQAAVGEFNNDDRPELVLFGEDQFAVLEGGSDAPDLQELASFETELPQAYPSDLLAGDINSDGAPEILMIETRQHRLEILRYTAPRQLQHALAFRVFEQKSFSREGASGTEPREGLVADVTGDGRADLILLAHDRLLIYPQDAGEAAVGTGTKAAAAASGAPSN